MKACCFFRVLAKYVIVASASVVVFYVDWPICVFFIFLQGTIIAVCIGYKRIRVF